MKKIIGLTGGIGSGKTTAAKIFESKGFPVYYSDIRAKEIVNDDALLKEKILAIFGENAYTADGMYNRKYVSGLVFTDAALLQQLNDAVHPAVKMDFEIWVQRQDSAFIFKETALLFELKLNESCHKTVLVMADDNLRIKRVMDRDGKTYREVEAIMQKQMPEKEKIKLADFIIYNNGSLSKLQAGTEAALQEILMS